MTKSIAITGGVASGKTTLARYLATQGFPIFDCDDEIHKLYKNSKVLKKITALFPSVIVSGALNKERLKAEITKSNLHNLERILYPYLLKAIQKYKTFYRKKHYKVIFFEVPLLLEKNWCYLFDDVILVRSTRRKRMKNFLSRGGDISTFRFLNNLQFSDGKKLAIAKRMDFKIISPQFTNLLPCFNRRFL